MSKISSKRTKMCGEFTAGDVGRKATVYGFVAKYRNLGSIIFVDLRDRTGILQLNFDEGRDKALFEEAAKLRKKVGAPGRFGSVSIAAQVQGFPGLFPDQL